MEDVMATTGYNFEGYRIVEYYGIVFTNIEYHNSNNWGEMQWLDIAVRFKDVI